MSIAERRQDFPMLKQTVYGNPLIYLDTAATAQKPQVVIDKLTDFYTNHYGTVHRAVYHLAGYATNAYQAAREEAKKFINAASEDEIIFTRGTTESINLVAYSFGKAFVKPGDEILISGLEHHSNIVPWQMLCEDRGAKLRVIPMLDNGELDLDAFRQLLNPKTKILAVGHIANSIGTINPIKLMIDEAHRVGAKVLIDGAQAAPHVPVNVQELNCDFYVFSGHKVYGPTGIGVLYIKASLLDLLPPYQGGGDMIEKVTFEKTTYNVPPIKFEAGTPIIAEAIALGEALRYLQTIGLENIEAYEHELTQYALEKLKAIPGITIYGPEKRGSIISFNIDNAHPLDVATMLDLRGIAVRTGHHCAQPVMERLGVKGTIRASFSFYNTREEIDAFAKALQEVIPLSKSCG
jgi:cysteine desulfurase/selenocysteine lyase